MADGEIPDRIWCNPEGHWHSFDDSESRYHPSVPCVRADLHDALAKERDELAARVKYLEGVGDVDGKLIQKTAGDAVRYKARAEKAESEVERLREALHNSLACGLPEVVAAAVIEALQRKEGNE